MDELDEFNEATHIVHGDVHINRTDPHDDTIASHQEHRQQRMSPEMLDDDEDIVLSTDDLLGGGSANAASQDNHTHQRISNGDLGGSPATGSVRKTTADWYVNT